MTTQEVKEHCQKMQQDKEKTFKDNCQRCEFWKSTRGCMFYSRPLDWKIKE